MANKTSLEKEIAQAEDRIRPKDSGNSLQQRLEDFTQRYQQGDIDDKLSQYPDSIFEKTNTTKILHKTADTNDLDDDITLKQRPKAKTQISRNLVTYTCH